MNRTVLRVEIERFSIFRDGLVELAGARQGRAQVVMDARFLRIGGCQLRPFHDRGCILALFTQFHRLIKLPVHVDCRRADLYQSIRGNVHEFRKVHGAVGCGRVINQDRRAIIPLGIDVGQIHLRIGPPALGRKHQPPSVGRKAMPGVHGEHVGAHAARLASFRRNNVQLAVRTHHLAVAALHKDDPATIRRHFGKRIAHAVLRRTGNGLRRPPFASVERNPVKIVLNLSLVGIISVSGHLHTGRVRIDCFRPGKDYIFPVGTPDAVGLHKLRIVCARQWVALAGGAVIPCQNSPRRIEHLKKAIVFEV